MGYSLEVAAVRLGGSPFWEASLVSGSIILNVLSDRWVWTKNSSGVFSVSSAYHLLAEPSSSVERLSDQMIDILNKVWKSHTPSRVIAFSWQLL